MRIYKLYANVTGTADAVAQITIAKTGRIKGVRWSASYNGVVDNEEVEVELSMVPRSFLNSNDTAGPIDELQMFNNGTSGGLATINRQSILDLPIAQGERLYLNSVVAGSPTGARVTCYVDVED